MDERDSKNRARNLLWDGSTLNDRTLALELRAAWDEGFVAGKAAGKAEAESKLVQQNGIAILDAAAAGANEMKQEIIACLGALKKSESIPARREFIAGIIDAVRELEPNPNSSGRQLADGATA